jgi:hypothetical protein
VHFARDTTCAYVMQAWLGSLHATAPTSVDEAHAIWDELLAKPSPLEKFGAFVLEVGAPPPKSDVEPVLRGYASFFIGPTAKLGDFLKIVDGLAKTKGRPENAKLDQVSADAQRLIAAAVANEEARGFLVAHLVPLLAIDDSGAPR